MIGIESQRRSSDRRLRISKVTLESSGSEQEHIEVIPNAEHSLLSKPKGSQISYHERVYLFKIMMSNERSMIQIATDYNLGIGTLHNIRKELGSPLNKTLLEKPITNINIVESPMIQKVIRAYLDTTKTPWTSKDLTAHIKAKVWLLLHERTVRNIMMKVLKMRYKKGLSRLVGFDEEHQLRIKQWFAIKVWRLFEKIDLLINID